MWLTMCPVPQSKCILLLHVTLCTKCEFLPFWESIFTINVRQFILADLYWWLWRFVPSKMNVPLKINPQVISVSKVCHFYAFQCFLLTVTMVEIKYTSSLHNAWWTGIDVSSEFTVTATFSSLSDLHYHMIDTMFVWFINSKQPKK